MHDDQALDDPTNAAHAFTPAADLLGMLRDKVVSSRELLDMFLGRIERFNPALNAIVTLDVEAASRTAAAADEAVARGRVLGPLHGLPMTVKDELKTAGMRTTFGSRRHASFVPTRDAVAVTHLREAGAIVFGKTNMPPFGSDVQTFNHVFGTTNNPWDLSRTPGGSSGGAAAALAAGLTPLELGTDIGGSIRTPAAYCGVYGHKPTWDVMPMDFPAEEPGDPIGYLVWPDIAVAGPLARTANDLALLLDVVAGPGPLDAAGWQLHLPRPRHTDLASFRVGAWLEDPHCETDAGVRAALENAVDALRRAGVSVDSNARPPFTLAHSDDLYRKMLLGAFGSSVPAPSVLPHLAALIPPVGPRLLRYAHMFGLTHASWLGLNSERRRLQLAWARFFERFDVLLTPVSPVAAIPHDHSHPLLIVLRDIEVNGHRRPYLDQLTWAGLTGVSLLPSTSAPVGSTPEGLPVGIQIVGPRLEDHTPIRFAALLADVVGGFTPPPGYT